MSLQSLKIVKNMVNNVFRIQIRCLVWIYLYILSFNHKIIRNSELKKYIFNMKFAIQVYDVNIANQHSL